MPGGGRGKKAPIGSDRGDRRRGNADARARSRRPERVEAPAAGPCQHRARARPALAATAPPLPAPVPTRRRRPHRGPALRPQRRRSTTGWCGTRSVPDRRFPTSRSSSSRPARSPATRAITQGVGVNRVPPWSSSGPRALQRSTPEASVAVRVPEPGKRRAGRRSTPATRAARSTTTREAMDASGLPDSPASRFLNRATRLRRRSSPRPTAPRADPAAHARTLQPASSPTSSSTSASSPTSVHRQAIEEARTAGRPPERLLLEQGAIDRRSALPSRRRALRPRPHRPLRLPGRHGGGEPDLGQQRPPLPGDAGRLRRRGDAAGRDGRPDQRPRASTTSRSPPDSTAGSPSPPTRTSRR